MKKITSLLLGILLVTVFIFISKINPLDQKNKIPLLWEQAEQGDALAQARLGRYFF